MSYSPETDGGITKEALAWTSHKGQRQRGGLKGRTESVRWTKSWGKSVIVVVKCRIWLQTQDLGQVSQCLHGFKQM